jgi:hypothetical protein
VEGDAGYLQVSVPVDLSAPTTVPVKVRFSVTSTEANSRTSLPAPAP